jgi:hypothetical protein
MPHDHPPDTAGLSKEEIWAGPRLDYLDKMIAEVRNGESLSKIARETIMGFFLYIDKKLPGFTKIQAKLNELSAALPDDDPIKKEIDLNSKKIDDDDDDDEAHEKDPQTESNIISLPGRDQKADPGAPQFASRKEAVEWVDKLYAVCVISGKFRVWDESTGAEIREPMTKRDFIDSLENYRIRITDENGDSKIIPVSKLWLEYPQRRTYHKIVFDPSFKHDPKSGTCNLWRGFAYKPKKGNCWKFLRFIRDVVCAGNKKHYRWVCAWIAQLVQQPHIKPGTAMVLIGPKGAGKSFFGKKIRQLLGLDICFKTAARDDLFGNWNDHLEHSLFVQLEEAIWAGSHKEMSELNEYITGDSISIKTRFHSTKQSLSMMRFLLNANPGEGTRGWTIPATWDERRYSALYVSEEQMNKKEEYFDPIDAQLDNGGYEALMYYFMHFPIHKYNLTRGLETDALRDQKAKTAAMDKSVKGWWIRYVHSGALPFIDVVDENDNSVAPKWDQDGEMILTATGAVSEVPLLDPVGEYYYVLKLKIREAYAKSIGKKIDEIDDRSFGLQFNSLFPEIDGNGNIVKINKGRRIKTVLLDGKTKAIGKQTRLNIYKIPKLDVCRSLLDAVVGYHNDWNEMQNWEPKEHE